MWRLYCRQRDYDFRVYEDGYESVDSDYVLAHYGHFLYWCLCFQPGAALLTREWRAYDTLLPVTWYGNSEPPDEGCFVWVGDDKGFYAHTMFTIAKPKF